MRKKLTPTPAHRPGLSNPWIWKMAWKDARFNLGRLFLFISSIIIGVAGMVAINSFNANLQNDMDEEAKELLGADVALESDNRPMDSELLAFMDSLTSERARDARFASMVYFPKNSGSRLIRVVALENNFPMYGSFETTIESQTQDYLAGREVMIDETLSRQFDVAVGDSLKVGKGTFAICGIVTRFPGGANVGATFSPSVYLPFSLLDETGLIQYGSRVEYNYYYKTTPENLEKIKVELDKKNETERIDWRTAQMEKDNLSRGFQNLYRYFRLLGFVALVLGCIGIASSILVYMREKRSSVAVLRCIGAGGWQIFSIFFVQVVSLGIIGSLLGIGASLAIQYFIPWVVKDFLPMEVTMHISWASLAEGMLVGLIISILFSALPLAGVRFVSPLEIIRTTQSQRRIKSKFRLTVIVLIAVFPWLFAVKQTGNLVQGTLFYAGLLVTFVLLLLISRGLLSIGKKLMPADTRFVVKQAFSNLFRPNNQTTVLVVVIGLGAFLISTMTLVQDNLLGQVEFVGSGEKSNTVLFDIQPFQKEGVTELVQQYDIPIQQTVPIVTMKIHTLKGKPVEEWLKDSTMNLSNWALHHEYRVTYRNHLINSEKLSQGQLMSHIPSTEDSILISVEDRLAERLSLEMGDEIVFNVQGVPITTYVGSIRQVDWQRVQTNFMVVFPEGILEEAPQFYVMVGRIADKQVAAEFQQKLVQTFPNVSLIDLNLILQTLDEIFDKVAFAIRFMALFSIFTGILVLSGAVINSKYARLKENVLLRTIGAMQKQINGMTLVEYGYLGFFAALAGSILAVAASWALSAFFFETVFLPDFLMLVVIWLSITVITMFIGWYNSRSILHTSPLEVLRREV